MVVTGGLIPTGFGLINIKCDDTSTCLKGPFETGMEQDTILPLLILTPAVLSGIQLLLLIFVYRIDTPVYYNQKGDVQAMREALKFVYKPYAIEKKVNEIMAEESHADDEEND